MITIVKVYDKQQPNTHREYCGRPGKGQLGLLGNPFWMKDESQRNEVCNKFQDFFLDSVAHKGYLLTWRGDSILANKGNSIYIRVKELIEIAKTQDIELACFCSPKRCHTETIKAYIEQALEDEHILAQAKELEASMY